MKQIVQILRALSYGDAIGNHTLAIHKELKKRGIVCSIYADIIDPRLVEFAKPISQYQPDESDIILYHLSTGTDLNRKITEYPGKIIINYHNITPPHFMIKYNKKFEKNCQDAYDDTLFLKDKVDAVIGDSNYNCQELKKMGYICPMYTVPIIMDFSDYSKAPDPEVMNSFDASNGITNIVFIGRIAPNKKQEDIITDFYYYSKYFNSKSRLILVGDYNNLESYYLKLKKYVKKLGLKNVIFTGHIKFSEILAYYRTADLLLCESEHEGFCVPLVEAMNFNIPVLAYNSSAISETLGDGGILLEEKNPQLTASIMDTLLNDKFTIEQMKINQNKRIEYFKSDVHVNRFIEIIESL